MKRTIAIIAGGDSSEHEVSMKSAEGIYSFIDKEKYNLYIVELTKKYWEAILPDGTRTPVDKNDFSFQDKGNKIIPDFAYITIHGTPGENGILQGYFELLDIPYSTCDVLVSAMTFSKFTLNQYLKGFGIRVAESMLVNKRYGISDEDVVEKIGLPCFIKPNASGSSFGVTKVKTREQIQPALQAAFQESDDVMIEAFMDGIELANGCYKVPGKSVVFPITEDNLRCYRLSFCSILAVKRWLSTLRPSDRMAKSVIPKSIPTDWFVLGNGLKSGTSQRIDT